MRVRRHHTSIVLRTSNRRRPAESRPKANVAADLAGSSALVAVRDPFGCPLETPRAPLTRLFCRPYSLEMPPLHETTRRFRERIPGRLRHLTHLLTHIIPQGQSSPQLPPDCIRAKVKNQMRRSTPRSNELKAPAELTHNPSARRVEGQAVSGRSAYKETRRIIGRGLSVPAAAIATVPVGGVPQSHSVESRISRDDHHD